MLGHRVLAGRGAGVSPCSHHYSKLVVTTSLHRPVFSDVLVIRRWSRWRLGFILGNGSSRAAQPLTPFAGPSLTRAEGLWGVLPPSRELLGIHVSPMRGWAAVPLREERAMLRVWDVGPRESWSWQPPSHRTLGCHIAGAGSGTPLASGRGLWDCWAISRGRLQVLASQNQL